MTENFFSNQDESIFCPDELQSFSVHRDENFNH